MTRTAPTVESLAEEMASRWAVGDFVPAEEFFDRHPALRDHPDDALELIAEELNLREDYARPTGAAELESRFPEWAALVRALHDCQRALGPQFAPPRFPEPGERLGEFDLHSELGRGAHGRVYRATQPQLADRPVVLKVGPMQGAEHLALARLQHTNIVPLYSAHDYPDRRLRALCMPHFGGRTLEDILGRIRLNSDQLANGRDLMEMVALPPARSGPVWGYLGRAGLGEAACWMVAGLADALQYAHDRGILHLDIKPSNILLAGDGVPMLLDFHLARSPLAADEPAPSWLGGTPAYMAPEHRDAVEAVRAAGRLTAAVDARADLYSLGLVLREFLDATGESRSLGLDDIVGRCLAPKAEDRYARAADLAADLRRHLADLPLRGVGNRSAVERWSKWRRRRPFAFPLALMLAAGALACAGLAGHALRQIDRAELSRNEARLHLVGRRSAEAKDAVAVAEARLEGLPFTNRLRSELREIRSAADKLAVARRLHDFAERLRFLACDGQLDPERAGRIAEECRSVWVRRAEWLAMAEADGRTDLLDIGVISAAMQVRAAKPSERATALAAALGRLDEVQSEFGPSVALEIERENLRSLTDPSRAIPLERAFGEPVTNWERILVGRALLAAGEAGSAVRILEPATRTEPGSFWANFYLGSACLRLDRAAEAVAAFTACTALAPRAAWCRFNRALAWRKLDRPDAARADFRSAIELDNTFWPAHREWAALELADRQPQAALEQLSLAEVAGAPRADTAYRRAVVQLSLQDRTAAREQLEACLSLDPQHAEARSLRAKLDTDRR